MTPLSSRVSGDHTVPLPVDWSRSSNSVGATASSPTEVHDSCVQYSCQPLAVNVSFWRQKLSGPHSKTRSRPVYMNHIKR